MYVMYLAGTEHSMVEINYNNKKNNIVFKKILASREVCRKSRIFDI